MRTYIYRELIAEAFTSMGKNNVNHTDIIKTFGINKTGHYCEIYKEYWGYSVHLYGEGFMNGYYPTIVDITEQKDVKALRTKIKTAFASNGVYTVLANPFYCVDSNKSKGKVKCCKNQCTGCWKIETM